MKRFSQVFGLMVLLILPAVLGYQGALARAVANPKKVWTDAVRMEHAVAVPEPGSLLLLGSGLLAGAMYLRKRFFEDTK